MQQNVQIKENVFTRDLLSGYAYVNINRFQKEIENDEGSEMVWMASWQLRVSRPVQTSDIIEEIIRSRYSASQVEALLANYAKKKDVLEYIKFQAWREIAKELAGDNAPETKKLIQVEMPLSFALSGGKYESMSDRVLKLGSPYEITHAADGTEIVTVWLTEVLPEHSIIITSDKDVQISEIILIDADEIF